MTPEKQRIAIAEACGWTNIRQYIRIRTHDRIHVLKGVRPTNGTGPVPNYLTDLNAMHEAEKVLIPWRDIEIELEDGNTISETAWEVYCNNLTEINGDEYPIHATAAQRAEAFLRTIGKWEDK